MSHLRNISKIFARNRDELVPKKTRTNMSHFDDAALPAICLPRLRLHYSSFSPSGGQAQWWAEQRVAVRRSQSVGKQWLYPPLVRFSTGEFQLFTLMVADGRGEGDGARSRGRSLASSGADERGRSLASSGMDRDRHARGHLRRLASVVFGFGTRWNVIVLSLIFHMEPSQLAIWLRVQSHLCSVVWIEGVE